MRVREALAVDLLRSPGVRTKRFFGLLVAQIAGSEAVTIEDAAGELACVAGVFEYDSGECEAWLAEGPALRANLLRVLRLLRGFLREAGAIAAGGQIKAYVQPQGVAGDRLARLLGFESLGVEETDVGPLKAWRRTL